MRIVRGILHFISRLILTVLLVGVLCGCFCGVAFAYYVHAYINPAVQEDVAQLSQGMSLDLNSFIYSVDPETGEETLYETLKGLENRVPVTISEVPQYLQDAVVAIEDQRYYQHQGVDWKRTIGAVKTWLLGGEQFGGSTITQQLIKNTTKDDDYSVKRKVNEIFRALALEEEIGDKKQILERYLNTIYLGYNCYGVRTAATTYFGKDVSQLSLAECAMLAGLTNNPSVYDPYNHPEKVKERQELILEQMLEQELITQSEYDAAKAEPLNYRAYEAYEAEQHDSYTYFTDAVIKDLIEDLMAKKGYSELIATDLVFSGGLKIYATIDTRIQQIMDEEYANDSNFPNMTRGEEGSRPQSAMVLTDKQGNIKGIVGGRGQKTGMRGFSRATDARRQPGSSIKPLAVYGPAMDRGIIVPNSSVYDKALMEINGRAWPRNDSGRTTGSPMVIKSAIAHSVNTIAVQVMNMLTPQTSYEYLTQRLGFKAGDDGLIANKVNPDGSVTSDIDYAPLALGGLTNGVTVREMAGGFSSFINDGVFAGTRTYSKVLDSDGNVLLDNTPGTELGFYNVRTAYYMLECMQGVTAYGTASNVGIPGVETAGKTGTTSANYDRWFCGVTPKYAAAVWFGFDAKYTLSGLGGYNPASVMWNKVLNRVHEGDSGLKFDSHPEDFETASYCMDSGLAPSGACRAAGRVATGRFWKGQAPTEMCTHQGFQSFDYGKNTGIDVPQEEEKPEEKDPNAPTDPNAPPADPTIDPETGQPVVPSNPNQPTTPTDPGGTDPGGTDPGGTDPGGTDPGGTDPGGTDPGGTDPGGTDPGPGTPDPPVIDPSVPPADDPPSDDPEG